MGELFLSEAPDPGGTVTEEDLVVGAGKAPAIRFTSYAKVAGRRLRVGVTSGGTLDGRRVGEVARIADGLAPGIPADGGPDHERLVG